jgi:hypothetical protein
MGGQTQLQGSSDLNGIEVYIHGGTVNGIFRELGTIFLRGERATDCS